MIYLAAPYSHPDSTVRVARFNAVTRYAADLLKQGVMVFSPITHSYPIACVSDIGDSFAVWEQWNLDMLRRCDELWVLQLDGWKESIGVEREITEAIAMEIPRQYKQP